MYMARLSGSIPVGVIQQLVALNGTFMPSCPFWNLSNPWSSMAAPYVHSYAWQALYQSMVTCNLYVVANCSNTIYAVSLVGAFCVLEAIFHHFNKALYCSLHEIVCPWLHLNSCYIFELSFCRASVSAMTPQPSPQWNPRSRALEGLLRLGKGFKSCQSASCWPYMGSGAAHIGAKSVQKLSLPAMR